MAKKKIQPNGLTWDINNTVAKLNKQLQEAAMNGVVVFIKPKNDTITPDNLLGGTKSVEAIVYPVVPGALASFIKLKFNCTDLRGNNSGIFTATFPDCGTGPQ